MTDEPLPQPYVTKSGRVLTPGQTKAMQNLRPIRHAGPGRPKGPSITEAMVKICKKKLAALFPSEQLKDPSNPIWKKRITEALVEQTIKAALKGDMRAIELLWDRIDGPVPVRVAGHDGGPLQVDNRKLQMQLFMDNPAYRAARIAAANLEQEAFDQLKAPATENDDGKTENGETDHPAAGADDR